MKVIQADHHRTVEIPGLRAPARRPVDIDKSQTGFANLRSLRIYSFDAHSVINGHAEEDEVLIVVLAGSVELTLSGSNAADSMGPLLLTAASESDDSPCAAYLPPHAAYRLVPHSDADVAYARATPTGGPPPRVFTSHVRSEHAGVALLIEESTYPRRLRLRLLQITAAEHEITVTPIDESEVALEALIHVRSTPAEGVATITTAAAAHLDSWDTLSVMPGEHTILRVAPESTVLVLVVLAA